MDKKYYAVCPGQIKIDNEVFFGIDYKITDFINELMEQVKKQKEVIDKINNYLDNYDVFRVFNFPLMKKWEEQEVKSSIDYEFKTSLIKDLKEILEDKGN